MSKCAKKKHKHSVDYTRHIFHGAVDVKLKVVIWVNFLIPCWNALFQKDYMKNSIKIDISLLNICSLTNLSFFFNGKSINQHFFPCPHSSVIEKNQSPALVWEPASQCGDAHVGYRDPQRRAASSRRVREVSSPQAPLLILCTELLVWGQQQADLSFPEPQRVVSQHRGRKMGGVGGGEYVYFRPAPQICTDCPNRPIQPCNTLILRANWVQGIQLPA